MQRSIVKLAQALAGEDDNVQLVHFSAVMSEGLTGYAFDPVAINRSPDVFLGNDQSQPCMCLVIVPGQQQQSGSRGLAGSSIEYVLELRWRQ